MTLYTVEVFETITLHRAYTVEAESVEEALELAEEGVTENEYTLNPHGDVIARHALPETIEVQS